MKKFFLFLAVAGFLSFYSCGSSQGNCRTRESAGKSKSVQSTNYLADNNHLEYIK